jgi:hypothetical protein
MIQKWKALSPKEKQYFLATVASWVALAGLGVIIATIIIVAYVANLILGVAVTVILVTFFASMVWVNYRDYRT